jgi:CelD/BcsL family acetyltransferase involved in cellulose biosynthesis
MKYEIIGSLDRLQVLEKPWDELVTQTESDHAFMRHLWFSELVKAYSMDGNLSIVAAFRDGLLVGLAPLYRSVQRFRHIKTNTLRFVANEMTPRCNFIVADQDAVEPLLKQVLALDGWDIIYLKNLEENLLTTRRIAGYLSGSEHGYGIQIADGFRSPFLITEGTFESYWLSFSKKRRKSLEKYAIDRLKEAEDSDISQLRHGAEWIELLPRIFEISSKSWKAGDGDNLSPDTPEGRLYADFSPRAIDRGLAAVYTIKIKGSVVGFDYCLRCGTKYAGVRSDFDDTFKYFSPGNNLRLAIIRDLFSNGEVCEYDFGGDVHDYKLDWCRSIRRHLTITIGNKNFRGRAIMAAKNVLLPLWRKAIGKRSEIKPEPTEEH